MELFGLPVPRSKVVSAVVPAQQTEDISLTNSLVIPTTSLRVETIPRFEPLTITQTDLPAWPALEDPEEIALVTPGTAVPSPEAVTEAALPGPAPIEQTARTVPDSVSFNVPLQPEPASPAETLEIAKRPFDLPLSTGARAGLEDTSLLATPVPARVAIAPVSVTDDPAITTTGRVRSEASTFWADAAVSIIESLSLNGVSLFGLLLLSLFGLGVGVFQRRLTAGPRGKV
jgi:hypothetical protein